MSTLLQTKSSGPDSYHLGEHSVLDIAKEYVSLGERPIPLCDPRHAFVSVAHVDGYRRSDGNLVPPCGSPGKAPLERSYPRFATELPTQADLFRMFNSHGGNIGGVVPEGRIVIDIDPRNGGLDSINAYVNQHGPLPWTPTVLTGGAGVHYYFLLPPGVARPKGGSLKSSGFPGVEWKGPGAQVVLPPSVHSSGEAYQWEPGGSLEDLPVALIPEPLLCLILSNARSSPSRSTSEPPPGDQNQPADLQRYFATLWQSVSVEIQGNIGDLFCVCPFHKDRNPSLHIDSQRCIWYCFSPGCKAFEGGGVHLLESLLGPIEGEHRFVRPSVLGKDSYPNDDAHFSNDVTYDLKARAGQLFPVPKELPPQVVVRLYAFREDPSRAVRHQVISNLWINPANRAIKRRMMWANLMKEIVRSPNHDALELYE